MQKTIALALLAASIVAFPVATPSFAFDASKSTLCGPDAPEGYKRPGGYCQTITENKSLIETEEGCAPYVPASFFLGAAAKPILVVEYCYDSELPSFAAV
ncbi:hypothetical protein VW23_011530 [Devosia insulae DS-56]|uniref:Porin n=1 Tax=Devosia insulae DS-56 TaxID=1116389 RepID=A0A1E5XV39_9HYPH|nr:hypothetical protein [Devosia insulae]OEO32446.1 hypothetical protein VW23_011530 [Devosia insulae DS-56]